METIKAGEVSLEPGFLERIRAQPACTERELVDRAIKFANSGSVKSYFNFAGQLAQPYQDDEREPDSPDFLKKKQYSLRSALTAIVERQITVERMRTWCRIASGVVPVASYSVDGDEVRTTFHYQEVEHFWGPEPDGLFALVLVWLLDPQRPWRDLCQCHWSGCGKFFFPVPPKRQGRQLRRYCTRVHMMKAHDAAGPERVRRSRENRKKRTNLNSKKRT